MTRSVPLQAGANAQARRILRLAVLALVAFDLALVVAQTLLYRALLGQPGSLVYVIEPIGLLLFYAALILAITWSPSPARRAALWLGTRFGCAAGALWLINLTLETFAGLSGFPSLVASASLLLGGFMLWGVGGCVSVWRTGSMRSGILAAVWSGVLCALLTVTYGFALLFIAFPTLQAGEANDPDFLRSGWRDLHAFVIANTFDAAYSHLLGALLIALIVGTLGAALGLLGRRFHGFTLSAEYISRRKRLG